MEKEAPVLRFEELGELRRKLGKEGRRLVLTNGCFDLLHAGHVRYLCEARALGDFLLVAVNSDASVALLKGPGRPLNTQEDRCAVLSCLRPVDAITVFDEPRLTRIIRELRPDVYAKGGDYSIETLDAGEREALEGCGAEIRLLSLVAGKSTTGLLERIREG